MRREIRAEIRDAGGLKAWLADMTERIRDLRDRGAQERDPTDRRRLDAEQMRARDAAVARLLRAGVTHRAIAVRLGMKYGSLQKAVKRIRGAPVSPVGKVRAPRRQSRFASSADEDS